MYIQIAQHIRRYIHRENKGEKTPFLPFMKKKGFFMMQLAKQEQTAKIQPFLKTSIF